jgi:hypothetical protein
MLVLRHWVEGSAASRVSWIKIFVAVARLRYGQEGQRK